MTDEITATISGNKALVSNMEAYALDTQQQVQAILESGGRMAYDTAVKLCPVSDIDTPGYVHMVDQMVLDVQIGVVTVSNESDHALYVELGTVKMAAQPFLMPAFDEVGPLIQAELGGF